MNPQIPYGYPYKNQSDDPYLQAARFDHQHNVAERLILLTGSILTSLLLIRFGLALLGANPANGFANFVYAFTGPFTQPFYNLFSYDHPSILGVATFEGYTLVAAAIYSLAAAGIAKIVTLTRH